jgi:hypothetical protein
VVTFLRLIAEWVAINLGYIVLISFLASLGSLAFALIQVQRKKRVVGVLTPIVRTHDGSRHLAEAAFGPAPQTQIQSRTVAFLPIQTQLGVSTQGGLGFSALGALTAARVSSLVIPQQIRGQGKAQEPSPESALIEAGNLKGLYGDSSYSPS